MYQTVQYFIRSKTGVLYVTVFKYFFKLVEWRRFVTYLSNDPRTKIGPSFLPTFRKFCVSHAVQPTELDQTLPHCMV